MSLRKIIFIVLSALLIGGVAIGVFYFSKQSKNKQTNAASTLTVWVVGGTSEKYDTLFSGFQSSDPAFAKTSVNVRIFPNYAQYQRILLSTLADGKGPDIFMVDAWGDDILSTKVEPIPDDLVNLSDFDKRYEDIFLPLLSSTGTKETMKSYLQWVPLGYETLGMFYNKSLLRTIPKTWNDLDLLYTDGTAPGTFPTNIGLSPRYTPFAIDILSLFLSEKWNTDYTNPTISPDSIAQYFGYGTTPLSHTQADIYDTTTSLNAWESLDWQKIMMDEGKLTTIDLFMRGKIAMVVGYPSLIDEIEKAQKRAGVDAVDALILTEHIPRTSLGKDGKNIARYSYLGLSKNTENPVIGAKFLGYLMSDAALQKAVEVFPKSISPVRSISKSQGTTPLSTVFARTKMEAFLPLQDEKVEVYHFGLRTEYEKMFTEAVDRSDKIDINNLMMSIRNSLRCEIESIGNDTLSPACESTEL